MIIGISATGTSRDSLLDIRFGRCEFFQIYNSENNTIKVVENQGQASNGGAGIVAAQQLVDEKVDIIITGNLGPNAFEIMKKADIKTYKCEGLLISDVLEKLKNEEVEEITYAGPSHSGIVY